MEASGTRDRPSITSKVLRHVIGGLAVLAVYGVVMVRLGSPHERTLGQLFVGVCLLALTTARTWWKEYRYQDDYLVWQDVPAKVPAWKLQPGDLPPAQPRPFPSAVERLPIVRDVNDRSLHDE